jgi:outer membrane receptor for ferrienterochelin and colicin
MSLRRVCVAALLAAGTALGQEPEKPIEKPRIDEVIVVTASRTEQPIHEAAAAVSVITAEDLEHLPVHDYGDILRSVPGLNVTQMGAREMQVTARAATTSLATSQLVLLDRRSVYLDFFGFVMWDLLPLDFEEIRQIEVVRGPASAVWGANAMTGVVNLITKSPKEMTGTSVVLGGGELGTMFASVLHADAREHDAYKISAGYAEQDAFDRPTGFIRGTRTPYPDFRNEGTRQPKVDLRYDRDLSDQTVLSFSGGYAGTDGIVHSGIGPFDLERGSSLSYLKSDWTRGAVRLTAFANVLDADSTNLLAIGGDGKPVSFAFQTKTYSLDGTNTSVVGGRHVLTYGATARHNEFDLSIARDSADRDEHGAFLQDEMLFGKARLLVGARWDGIEPIGSVVSPRMALLYSPAANHTVRVSFGRAFRAPSAINSDLETTILNQVLLPTGTFVFATRADGNRALAEERLDAWEIGYVGTIRQHAVLSVNVYRNTTKDVIDFHAASFYTSANPPAHWPLPAQFLDAPPLRNAFPATFSYRNIGRVVNKGVEVALNARPVPEWSWFVNYSYQADPETQGIPAAEINAPPSDRLNAGASWDRGRFFLTSTVHYQSKAEWRDVLDARYWGPTESFTSLNAGAGARVNDNITVSVLGTNVTDEKIQQHVFGDIVSRRITAQVRFRFP